MDIWLEKVKLESDYSIGRIFRSNREKRTAVHGVAGILADTGVRGSRRRLMGAKSELGPKVVWRGACLWQDCTADMCYT